MSLCLQNKFSGLLASVTSLMGAGGAEGVESMIQKLEQLKGLIDQVLGNNEYLGDSIRELALIYRVSLKNFNMQVLPKLLALALTSRER